MLEHQNLQLTAHLVLTLAFTTGFLAQEPLYADSGRKATEIFGECMSIFGLILLQQFQYTDDETARAVIEGTFIACLVLIALSNLAYLGLRYKYTKFIKGHNLKVQKVDKYCEKLTVQRSIGRYARVAER